MTVVVDPIGEKALPETRRRALKRSASTPRVVGATVIVLAGVLVGLALGVRDMRVVLFDDAAIMMRYAARIAGGDGWTYNDDDRTNGASAPLYTLALTVLHVFGLNLETAAKTVGVTCFAATFGLAARLGDRIGGPVAGVAAITLLAGSTQFRFLSMSGMESGLAAALGMAAILLATYEMEWVAGVLVGLAVLNKLDAGFLAIAIAVGLTVAYRRLPWRLVVAAVVTFAPWAIFAQLYFGSVLPHSAEEKLTNQAKGVTLNHFWMLEEIGSDPGVPVLMLGMAALVGVGVLLVRRELALAAGLLSLILWPILHIIAFSYLNFGEIYAWYTTVVYPPITVAAACTLGLIVRSGWWTPSLVARLAAVGLALGLGGYAVYEHRAEWRQAKAVLAEGHLMDGYEAFEQTRRDAGMFLGQTVQPGDVVRTCYGWPAYGALQATIAETCPLSTRKPVGPPRWHDGLSFPDHQDPPDRGFHLVRSFVSTHSDGGSTQIYARNGS